MGDRSNGAAAAQREDKSAVLQRQEGSTAAAGAAADSCCCSRATLLAEGCRCGPPLQQQQVPVFSCCDTTSVDALLLVLLAKVASDHPQLIKNQVLDVLQTTIEKQYAAASGLSESDLHHRSSAGLQQQQQQRASASHTAGTLQQLLQPQQHQHGSPKHTGEGSSMSSSCSNCCSQRIVVVGLQCRSSSKDLRLLRWARSNLLHANDVVVLVSCWELATDPKFVRVPGMILAATSAAAAYNRQQQQQVQQRMRDVAAAALRGLHVYCFAVPVGSTKKTSVGDLLCRVSGELRADAILLGARNHWQLTRMLFGSVSAYTRMHARCAVLQCGNT